MRPSFILVAILLALLSPLHGAASWRPIPPEELAAERPAIDPSAGAVVLLREITIDNGDFDGATQAFYVRTKIFDQKGIDAVLQTQIPYAREQPPRGLAARVVRPDGTSVEVEKKSIYTREIVRVGREARLAKSFTFPALTPGCIIEFQYRVNAPGFVFGMQLELADVHPTQMARIRLRPFPIFGTNTVWSGLPDLQHLAADKKGFHVYEARNIPAVVDEPLSPPDSVTKPWFLFYLTLSNGSANDYWSWVALELSASSRQLLAPTKSLKNAALKLTADIAGDASKLQRLYDYCRTEIKNLSHDTCGYTPEQIEDLKPNKSPSDVLSHGYGTETEINILFAALANALGARCNLTYAGDRSRYIFKRNLQLRDALPHVLVSIGIGSGWRFYDPGALYLPCGQVRWMSEGTPALVVEDFDWKMIDVPRSAADYSTTRRTATLRLDENGTIEGDVTIELTGHDGIAAKHEFDAKSDDERLTIFRSALEARLGTVELTDLVLRNVADPNHPIQISYHVKAENYAATTGDRIILQPAFFQKGVPAPFTAATRVHGINFPFAYVTKDEVTIDLPPGFDLEEPKAPSPINVNRLFFYDPQLKHSRRSHRLILQRNFTFDGEDFTVDGYDFIKKSFERVLLQDAHAVSLRRATPADTTTPVEPAEPAATP